MKKTKKKNKDREILFTKWSLDHASFLSAPSYKLDKCRRRLDNKITEKIYNKIFKECTKHTKVLQIGSQMLLHYVNMENHNQKIIKLNLMVEFVLGK